MKTINVLSAVVALSLSISSFAQTALTNQYNGYRNGDKLYRVVADHTSLGSRGENCVWEIPSAKKESSFVKQIINLRNDSLTITEGDLMIHYIATDKDVSMYGFQTRDMYGLHDRPLQEMKYPFAYGDSISGTYSRKTTYYDLFLIEGEGVCYTVCDGWGVLTDGTETLKDVLRVHHHNTIVSQYDSMDGDEAKPVLSEVTEDKYLWYYPGCRYPVMDTRIVKCKENGKTVSDTTFTSLYLPELQYSELAYDDANRQLIAQKEASRQIQGDNDSLPPFPLTMAASLQADGREIRLDYVAAENLDATFYACDLTGRLLGQSTHGALGKGEHHETISLKSRPVSGIVVLTMVVGGRIEAVKVS